MFHCAELSALLSGNLAKVLEDYDALRCTDLYSNDSLPHISSNRSDAVSITMSHIMYNIWNIKPSHIHLLSIMCASVYLFSLTQIQKATIVTGRGCKLR